MDKKWTACSGVLALAAALVLQACAQTGDHAAHIGGTSPTVDLRPLVKYPDELRIHTLNNMRDHLMALQEIQYALAKEQYDKAADVAELRLGMTSLKSHGAHDVAKYLPTDLQSVGSGMHRAASRFAVAAKDVSATGDVKPALSALSELTAKCVACHAAFRIQ